MSLKELADEGWGIYQQNQKQTYDALEVVFEDVGSGYQALSIDAALINRSTNTGLILLLPKKVLTKRNLGKVKTHLKGLGYLDPFKLKDKLGLDRICVYSQIAEAFVVYGEAKDLFTCIPREDVPNLIRALSTPPAYLHPITEGVLVSIKPKRALETREDIVNFAKEQDSPLLVFNLKRKALGVLSPVFGEDGEVESVWSLTLSLSDLNKWASLDRSMLRP